MEPRPCQAVALAYSQAEAESCPQDLSQTRWPIHAELGDTTGRGEGKVKSLFVATQAVVLLVLEAAAQTGSAPSRRVTVSIDASKTGAPISPYLYGQFIEHIGDLVNRSVWAEILDDRKFYYPITSSLGDQRPVRGRRPNRWMPIGPDSSVTMDGDRPWVGDHSPRLTLAGAESRGIRQSGLALREGKAYTGRVVLSGSPGAKLAVSLAWGSGPGERQSLPLSSVSAEYKTWSLKFVAEGNTDDGRIEISGTGRARSISAQSRSCPPTTFTASVRRYRRPPEGATFGNVPFPGRQLPFHS